MKAISFKSGRPGLTGVLLVEVFLSFCRRYRGCCNRGRMYAAQEEAEAWSSARTTAISTELIGQFVNGPVSAEAIQDASMAFKKALIERALGAEFGAPPGLT